MKIRPSYFSAVALAAIALFSTGTPAEARRLNVLFLGHKLNMHPGHATQERCMDLMQGLGPRGVDLDFVDEPAKALDAAVLKNYDALAIYANWEKITPEQEKALLEYVESGRGFVPIHCASYCFLKSMPYTQMVGARFQRHDTGEFDVTTTKADHPVMAGFQNFRTWDETYVHTLHNEDKLVLQRRVDAAKNEDEPWTWVRNQGKGRVFYTAYGHNEKTWKQPGFHELMYRGIVWAVGEKAAAEHKELNLKPLEYVDGAFVPNYERRVPAPRLQQPLEPEDAKKHISVPAGMNLELFASEKDGLWNVIEFKFDEQGRMWTCESLDYPNERKPQGEGRDRIRILEDADGDGRAEKITVFAEGLSIPTSLVFANDGIIVTNLPDTTFLRDTDGDGKADEKKVLFTGWGTGDTHACPSSLAYGFDGWIYGCVGYGGFSGTVGGKEHRFGQALYRFKTDGSVLEKLGGTSNNTWGFGMNENGDLFGSTANGQSSFYCPIPGRYYESVPGLKQGILEGIDMNRRAPITREYVRQVDVMGGFTSAACHNFYTARSFPQTYWNSVAFIAEPTCHILYQGLVRQVGSHFQVDNGMNLIASDDEWFAPVYASAGPEGAVYVSDFYSFLIQHNPTPSVERGGFKAENGKGNAFVSTLRDTERARIWKVTNKSGKASKTYKLSKKDPATLLEALGSDNLLWRSHAQRLVVESGNKEVAAKLKEMVADEKVDAVGVSGRAFGALWALAGLGEADLATVTKALKHPATGVRRAAAQNLPKSKEGMQALLDAGLLEDKEPLVQLTALLTLSEMPASGVLGSKLYALSKTGSFAKDRWLPTALTVAAAKHALGYLGAAIAGAVPKAAGGAPGEAPKNLLANPGFEDVEGDQPKEWKVRTYSGNAEHAVDTTVAKSGKNSVRISSPTGSDTSYHFDLSLEPDTDYLFSAWIKAKDLQTRNGGKGAMIELHQLNGDQPYSPPLKGNTDWSPVALPFNSGRQKNLSLNLLFGGWGHAIGTMWVDDVSLIKLGKLASAGPLPQIANAFAFQGTPEAKGALKAAADAKPSAESEVILSALARGGEIVQVETIADLRKTHQVLKLSALVGQMKYDLAELTAKAGKPIVIEFKNPDALQHNVIVGKPGTYDKLNAGSMKMMADPNALAKAWIPQTPDVIGGTLMADPNVTLLLKLPALEPGEYPYLCTFPSHSAIMKGVLKVEK